MATTLQRQVGARHVQPAWFDPSQPEGGRAQRRAYLRKQRRAGIIRSLLASLLILGGVGMGGSWAWDTFGTSWMLRDQMNSDIEQFSAQVPQAPAVIAAASALRTDFELFPPPAIDMEALDTAEPFGLLTVPSWQGRTSFWGEELNNRILVKQGGNYWEETNRILDTGAAVHYTGTAGPGDIGNFSVSAHRRSYGDNFLFLPDLVVGDWVLFESAENWYVFRVIGSEIVTPYDMHVVNPDPFSPVNEDGTQNPTRRLITLTTCTTPTGGAMGNSHRWITHGELYGWMPRSEGKPPMIDNYWDDSIPDEISAQAAN